MVVLCAGFPGKPPLPVSCPVASEARDEFVGEGSDFPRNQVDLLLHDLVHWYVIATVEVPGVPQNEKHDINECFSVSVQESQYNPNNYLCYVNSTSPFRFARYSRYIGLTVDQGVYNLLGRCLPRCFESDLH